MPLVTRSAFRILSTFYVLNCVCIFKLGFLSHVDLMEFSFYMLILGFQGSDWGISE